MSMALLWLVMAGSALASPLTWSGRVLGPDGGARNGPAVVTFDLYDTATSDVSLFREQHDVTLEDGAFRVVLGEQMPLDSGVIRDGETWIEVSVDGLPAELRSRLPAVAMVAVAGEARQIVGGDVSASELRINGVPVIAADGSWLGAAVDVVGPRGASGPTGLAGDAGARGVAGAPGARGPTGPQGSTGATGSRGSQGATGSTGSRGNTGATGAAGPQYGCMFRPSCPSGWSDYGLSGFILNNGNLSNCGALRSCGAAYNSGWTWAHPKLCCRG